MVSPWNSYWALKYYINILLIFFFLNQLHLPASAQPFISTVTNSSWLHLHDGFSFSLFNTSSGPRINISSSNLRPDLTEPIYVSMPTPDGGLFFPILNSPSFTSNTSSTSSTVFGFSLGFLASHGDLAGDYYLAVCAGTSGNISNIKLFSPYSPPDGYGNGFIAMLSDDGYAVPVWIANVKTPISSPHFSLAAVPTTENLGTYTLVLHLTDGSGIHNTVPVWSIYTQCQ